MMAKNRNKKTTLQNEEAKNNFRIVKDSPATSKISKTDIEKAVKKAIALTSR